MVRAARLGQVDFRRCHVGGRAWWRRCRLLLEDMARADEERLAQAGLLLDLALVANGQLTEDSWTKARKRAVDSYRGLIDLVQPWGARSDAERKRLAAGNDRELYVRHIGDPDDPEFKKVLAADIAAMEADIAAAPAETEQESLDRLLRERASRRRGE